MKLPNACELKLYPEMKDSSVEWLGKVPEHWLVRKLRHTIRSVAERNRPDLPLLSVVRERGVIVRDVSDKDENHNFIPDDLTNYKVVKRHQFAMNKMKAWQGSYGVSNSHGIVSPAYFVFDIEGANPDYFHTAIRSKAYIPYFTRASDGVRIGQWDLSIVRMREIPFLVPPVSEQAAIVRFLDHADRRIRRYIRAKQKLIALLEEQKQAIIHQAVTGQIDVRTGQPYPAYKPSGVEWLEEVPEHWQLLRLKDVAQVQTGLTLGKDYRSTRTISRPYLRVANVQAGCLDLTHVKSINVPLNEADRTTLLTGDVLMTEGGDIDKLGRGCVWRDEIPGCLHQNHIFAVRCRRGLLSPEFLVGLMGSIHGRAYFEFTAKQTTNLASTNSSTLRKFPVFLPVLEEQVAILNVISEETNALDNAIGRSKREIDLIQEYRTRLIADVVTGKLDVRGAATELPEVDTFEGEDTLDDFRSEADFDELDATLQEANA